MKPEQRAKWLNKACRSVEEKSASANQLYDVVSSKKIANGVAGKVGQQMLRTLLDHMAIFSEKQQRFLRQESPLVAQFGNAAPVTTAKVVSKPDDDAALRMEEMMARCRTFVRENASSYEERQQKCAEEERQRLAKLEEQEREEAAQRQHEAELWQRSLDIWERAQMTAMDLRAQEHAQKTKADGKADGERKRSRSVSASSDKSRRDRRNSRKQSRRSERSKRSRRRRRSSTSSSRSSS